MKTQLNILFLVFFSCNAIAQNVGIGTTNPTEKLEVKNPIRSTLKISSANYTDTTQIMLSNRAGNSGTDFSIKSIGEEGLFFSSLSDIEFNVSPQSLVIKPTGQIGIGMLPLAKLHINGNVKIEGQNLFELGAGIAGKETNAGKIGYNGFGQNALTFVGAGTSILNRRAYFFAEGGTTFNGKINVGGSIEINGNAGAVGQVLTSNGNAAPSWQNIAENYPALDRLMVPISATPLPSAISFSLNFATANYNLNPSNFTVGSNSITINDEGLYEIEGAVLFNTGNVVISAGENAYVNFSLTTLLGGATKTYTLARERIDQYSATFATSFEESMPYKIKLHLFAGTVISLRAQIFQYSSGGSPQAGSGFIGIVKIN
jgi:hypothetical protein